MKYKIFVTIFVLVLIIVFGWYYINYSKPIDVVDSNKIYSVSEVLAGNFEEGTLITAQGYYGARLINPSIDYEGPGGGSYISGDTSISGSKVLHFKSGENGLENYQEIVIKGEVDYCGGKKIPRYICQLLNTEVIEKK